MVEAEKLLKEKEQEFIKLAIESRPILFLKVNQPQKDFLYIKNPNGKTPKRRIFEAGNKEGKTWIGIAEDLAHSFGHRPWKRQGYKGPEEYNADPDYKIDIRVPNVGLIGCETMMHSVPEKIDPMLRLLIPPICQPIFKPGPTGVLIRVTLPFDDQGNKCGSVIHIRSYDQQATTFEGIDYDWEHWDEPPPQKVLIAAERGKIVTNAPSWFTMTPLKEPYIYDMFSLNAYNLGGNDNEIAVVRGSIWDNCRNYCWYCQYEIHENDDVRTIARCPKCNRLQGFIPKAGIDEYLKTLDPDERESREFGTWHHLSGLVYKELSREVHVYEDFPIPKNWMRVEGIDPHDARPTHWLFGAVSPEEIEIFGKVRHRIYFYDHLLLKGSIDEMVAQVKGMRATYGYQDPAFVVLDKKWGSKENINPSSPDADKITWQTELERRGVYRIRLSQSSPGDVELGHKVVKEYLKSAYSALLAQAKPGIMFAKKGCGNKYGPNTGPLHYMFNYQYKEGQSKPLDDYKDWPDVVRYISMEEPVYKSPDTERKVIDLITERNLAAMRSRRMF